jgi:hypothetical protein
MESIEIKRPHKSEVPWSRRPLFILLQLFYLAGVVLFIHYTNFFSVQPSGRFAQFNNHYLLWLGMLVGICIGLLNLPLSWRWCEAEGCVAMVLGWKKLPNSWRMHWSDPSWRIAAQFYGSYERAAFEFYLRTCLIILFVSSLFMGIGSNCWLMFCIFFTPLGFIIPQLLWYRSLPE